MVEYNTIKFCKSCKKKFVVSRGGKWKFYCSDCQAKIDKKQKVSS